ncbi:MAG: MFS transporter, partial [Chloroflexi bacterium]|nr:MFS transporter [Chloroflexota bacterium]
YALSFLQFVGLNGAAALPAGKLVGSWFRTRAGRVMGLTMMGVNFGGITLPLIVGPILASGNWQLAYQLYAIMAFVFAGAVLAFVNDPPATALAESAVHHSKVAAIGRRRRPPAPLSFTVRQALRTRTFYALTLAIMLSSFTHTAVLPQVAAHFSSQGVSRATVPLVISLLSACGMAAKPIFGFLSERLGAKMAMMISLTGQSVGLAYIALASTTAAVWTSVALFGLFMGAHSVMIPLLTRDSFGLRNIGSIMGLITMSAVLPWAIGPVLAGLSYDIGGTYAYGFVGVAVGYVVGVMALTQVKRMDEMERR